MGHSKTPRDRQPPSNPCRHLPVRRLVPQSDGQRHYGRLVVSAVGRLLDELSWEGNARKYRGGGRGLENVLTTEVFQALDLLPRDWFLGRVLRAAHEVVPADGGASAVVNAAAHAEGCSVEVLLGDLALPDLGIKAQPDVVIESESSYVFVEAKRVRQGAFQAEQVARELLLAATHGHGRRPVLLLVVGEPPPIAVKGHGRLPVDDAVELGLCGIETRLAYPVRERVMGAAIAYVTWAEIAAQVEGALGDYRNADLSTARTVERLANALIESVVWHS